ncbi:CYFA0S08e00254g1_1 [Cyberlindnera fabianii]|uniref:CYFA0S08e00254g1_1 n=1 Tax=Cyberlindnera fabianii TaxID=36022 RepID=A0A061AVX6_CYBFA|nr:Ceramide synthase subunit LIP1 [Cyberlindnera fabianii]CDR41807.1 CYFA0S08e00254g1_1 [Cyberlindnera fabianii]
MGIERIPILIEITVIVLAIVGGIEYFKFSTRMNYDWFHCTAQITQVPGTEIVKATAIGGPSCDARGQLKTITKKLTRKYDPNHQSYVFCLKEDDKEGVIGYVANTTDEALLTQNYCSNVIHW